MTPAEDINVIDPDGFIGVVRRGPRHAVYRTCWQGRDAVAKVGPRAEAEAALLRRAAHPRVLPVWAIGATRAGAPAFVAPLAASDLDAALSASGRFTPARAIAVLQDIAAGLAHLHRIGMRHGDLAPANCLLTEGGRVILADFEHAGDATTTGSTVPAGIFAYMAPEVRDGLPLAPTADVYGFGAIGWALLGGAPPAPFAPPPPGPAALLRLLEDCLSPNTSGRPVDGAELTRRMTEIV